MKTDRASSVTTVYLECQPTTTFSLPAFLRSKLRSRAVAVLILLLSGLQFQPYGPSALAARLLLAGKDGTARERRGRSTMECAGR